MVALPGIWTQVFCMLDEWHKHKTTNATPNFQSIQLGSCHKSTVFNLCNLHLQPHLMNVTKHVPECIYTSRMWRAQDVTPLTPLLFN